MLAQTPGAALRRIIEDATATAQARLTASLASAQAELRARVEEHYDGALRARLGHECRQSVEGAYAETFNDARDAIRDAAGDLWIEVLSWASPTCRGPVRGSWSQT